MDPTEDLNAGLSADDHCQAFPSDVYRLKRDLFRRKKLNPAPAAPPRSSLPGSLQAPAPPAIVPPPLMQPKSVSKPQSAPIAPHIKAPPAKPTVKQKVLKMHQQLNNPKFSKDLLPVGMVRLPVKVCAQPCPGSYLRG